MFLLLTLGSALVGDTTLVARFNKNGPALRFGRTTEATLEADSLHYVLGAAIVGGDLIVNGLDTELMRFDRRTGRFRGLVTRIGNGPGEFLSPLFLHAMPGDSLFVYDQSYGRFTVLAPSSYDYVRGGRAPGRTPRSVLPWNSGTLVTAAVVGQEGVGQPIHEFAPDASWLRSYGNPGGRLGWERVEGFERLATIGRDSSVWTVSHNGPTVLERFVAGQRTNRIEYAPEIELERIEPGPTTTRYGLLHATPGVIWILTQLPDPEWRDGTLPLPGEPTGHDPAKVFRIGSFPLLYDAVIDAVAIGTGEVLARIRLDEWVSQILPGGLIVTHAEDPNGQPLIRLERLTLHQPTTRR